eukprot:TRINITY_DN24081_c0_g1_i1.p1 TRINITY_DN24081_c0_g1~~TRINITY_DN24081_c0_g1_i1.p1  ORF type:complete len:907 (+),score=212.86 TRINITY_DN24081_c0_g1_i1:45-2765(+)
MDEVNFPIANGKVVRFWVQDRELFYSVGLSKGRGPVREILYDALSFNFLETKKRVTCLQKDEERVVASVATLIKDLPIKHNMPVGSLPTEPSGSPDDLRQFDTEVGSPSVYSKGPGPLAADASPITPYRPSADTPAVAAGSPSPLDPPPAIVLNDDSPALRPLVPFSPLVATPPAQEEVYSDSSSDDGHFATFDTTAAESVRNKRVVHDLEQRLIQAKQERILARTERERLSGKIATLEQKLPQDVLEAPLEAVCPGCNGVTHCKLWCPSKWHSPEAPSDEALPEGYLTFDHTRCGPCVVLTNKDRTAYLTKDVPSEVFSSGVITWGLYTFEVELEVINGRVGVGADCMGERVELRSDGLLIIGGNTYSKHDKLCEGSRIAVHVNLTEYVKTVKFYVNNVAVNDAIDVSVIGGSMLRPFVSLTRKGDRARVIGKGTAPDEVRAMQELVSNAHLELDKSTKEKQRVLASVEEQKRVMQEYEERMAALRQNIIDAEDRRKRELEEAQCELRAALEEKGRMQQSMHEVEENSLRVLHSTKLAMEEKESIHTQQASMLTQHTEQAKNKEQTLNAIITQLEEQLREHQSVISSKDSIISQKNDGLASFKQILNQADSDHAALQQDFAKYKMEKEEELNSAIRMTEELERQASLLRETVTEHEGQISTLECLLDNNSQKLVTDMRKKQEELEIMETTVQTKAIAVARLEDEVIEQSEKISTLTSETGKMIKTAGDLQQAVIDKTAECEDLKGAVRLLEDKLAEHELNKRGTGKAIDELRERMEDAHSVTSSYEEVARRNEAKLEKMRNKMARVAQKAKARVSAISVQTQTRHHMLAPFPLTEKQHTTRLLAQAYRKLSIYPHYKHHERVQQEKQLEKESTFSLTARQAAIQRSEGALQKAYRELLGSKKINN